MNCWNFVGHLGQDCELRHTPDGTAVVNFSVAVRSGYGEREKTTWARCAMFGKRGESVSRFLNKGQQVAISGEVTLNEWVDREGMKRSSLEVRVNDLELIGKRDDTSHHGSTAPQAAPPTAHAPAQQPQHAPDYGDDAVPF